MKKEEAWINTITHAVTYLMRGNTDVTSLLSGTAIKSVIAYVADYITKTPLKTHVMFQSIQQVFERNVELLGSQKSTKERARSLITKIVNSLTACSEIGGPMAAMYLLKHPDHYKSHKFRTCFWRGYVYEVMRAWEDSAKIAKEGTTKVMLGLSGTSKRIIALSPVQDYIWRPTEYEHMSLYDWVRLADKQRIKHSKKGPKKSEEHIDEPADVDSEFEDNYDVSDAELKGAGVNEEEEESEDELLLTKTSNQELEADSAPKPKKARSKYVQFHENHPQYETHHVKLLDESEAYVPNFIGGSLPRRDAGNREQY
ncbi:uncharacterized protein TRAVEDRAFT_45119 [Trametes versicolor FP-101664 SS1]|uniref:uncharacterized protein n=1 Tax=Trametes versicolor (strain FP-101664) TaxID=717944 RepID=UPI0004622BC2|nr:uncharacterized protein TRAVEDRAFT_45119 [Trametes versicolor FP-101664 SS1]EIW62291.1 hypothetical protein TRAVEDRAFT_45119 [Trametes versicolor FP-101664 SS1]